MIIITGAAGFIASALVGYLNQKGLTDIVVVDDFSRADKVNNLKDKKIAHRIERELLFDWLRTQKPKIDFVFHLGARTDTTEFDYSIFEKLNIGFSQEMWRFCTEKQIPLVYASSAATYGLGELGYEDREDIVNDLKPLNPYGVSKNEFDKWVLTQTERPPFWYGLKFFNVYGANEYHKGRMASVIFHAFKQIRETGSMKLFKSHNPKYRDGEQLRDFVYVKDVVQVCEFLSQKRPASGLYNLGTGWARTFLDLAHNTFYALELEPKITFVETPIDIRDKYQYYTEADILKLRSAGYQKPFSNLEYGITDYVQNYLVGNKYL